MVLGEKLWEGKAKTMSMVIKAITSEGMTFEHTWIAQVKGLGKAKGLDGSIMETEVAVVTQSGSASATGNALFNLPGNDTAVIKALGVGKGEGQSGMGLYVWSFMTNSKELDWLNKTLAVATQEGDPQEFDLVVWEWK
ncbi:MAG: hypothetical protein ACE14S_04300 [Candidatus Bathyarchaeia archaeon]